MEISSIEIIDNGLRCLSEHLGAQETELFISTLLRERFDYTKWRKTLTERVSSFDALDELIGESKDKAHSKTKTNLDSKEKSRKSKFINIHYKIILIININN